MMKVLVIAPHADDAEFGLGGYLHRLVRCRLADVTVGVIAGGDYTNRCGELVSGRERAQETVDAMTRLGVRKCLTLGAARENEFDLAGRRTLLDAVDHLLGLDGFEEVFVPLPSLNQDHEQLYQAALCAFRPGRWEHVKRIWAYEYPGHVIGHQAPLFGRCYVVFDLGDMEAKLAALWCHRTQFGGRTLNHCGPEGALKLAALRGSECGAEYAELVWLVREVY